MKKACIAIIVLLIIIGIVAAIVLSRGKQPEKPVSGEAVTSGEAEFVDVPKREQTGTAGSGMPLKDVEEEARQEIASALSRWIDEAYGEKVEESVVNVTKVYSAEDEAEVPALAEMNLGIDKVAFEAEFELKPANSGDIIELTIPNGEYDEESNWVIGRSILGILIPNPSGDTPKYVLDNLGTGW